MSAPKKVREHTREAFRIDAKAEGDHIMIGGWEILEEGKEEKGRWFAIELNRKNAPWAYLKGDPFRNIASLELCAVLTAVMLFGDKLVDVTCKNRLMLTASTDNLGNTYVLQHFMSCKYPLSRLLSWNCQYNYRSEVWSWNWDGYPEAKTKKQTPSRTKNSEGSIWRRE